MSTDPIQKAAAIIQQNVYMSLATLVDGVPWVSPVFYVYDQELNFYFHSRRESAHAKALLECAHVSFAIFDSTKSSSECDGLQASAQCSEINDLDELTSILPLYYQRADGTDPGLWSDKWKQPDLYLGQGTRRFYKITLDEIFKPHGGEDRRVKLDKTLLKQSAYQ